MIVCVGEEISIILLWSQVLDFSTHYENIDSGA